MTSSIKRLAVGLIAAALVLTGCSSSGDTSSGAKMGDTITLGLVAEPPSLDFTTTDGAATPQALLDNIYETLVKADDKGKIVPALAKSWQVSDDGLTYTFDLVDNAKFTNGEPFTADDAAFSINRVKTDWKISLKSAMDVVTSATATSPTELTVVLAHPSNDWLFRMTTRLGAMMSKTGGVADLANAPVGTGPYKFANWTRGTSIEFTRNDDYWGKKPYFKTVIFKYFKDPTAMNNAMLAGTIDVITTVQAPESLDQFTKGPKAKDLQVIEGTTNGEVVLSFNQAQGPLADLKVRQAIRYGINHKELLDNCWAGKGTLIGSMAPPTDPWYVDRTKDYPFDPKKSQELLKETGQTNLKLRLRLPTLPYATACGTEVKSQLSKVGIEVDIDTLEFPAKWLDVVYKQHDYDVSIIAHTEPRDTGAVFGNPNYYTQYKNPAIQPLLKEADEGSPEVQIEKMKEVEKLISEDAAADFLFLLPNLMVAKLSVTGLPKNAIGEAFRIADLGSK